ncbi:MAG: hypothetical protein GWO24_31475, partial [Akkermansiaceae bacterium]|nr:hypothetical protein [Akkermansiaceae bacterium]
MAGAPDLESAPGDAPFQCRQPRNKMSGKQVFNWREGDRNEYLAEFLLSAVGLVTPVPRQGDVGVDLFCSLVDQEKGATTFGYPFLVQL